MKVFVFDSKVCNGCYGCQIACKDEHWMNDWSPYSKPEPDTGQFWCNLHQRDHGQVPKVRVEYLPIFGGQDPAIAEYAPEVMMEREDGLQVIMPEKAVGRKDIADKFPGKVWWNEELQIPQACTGCAHLVDDGELPHCVDLCATGGLRFGDYEDFAAELEADGYEFVEDFDDETREVIPGIPGKQYKVYYKNLPHFFIGGEIWDEALDEIIEGATIKLSGDAEMETTSDEFGDFWFRKLDAGTYTVTLEAEGFITQTKEVQLTKSLNIGDFPMQRTADNQAVKKEHKVWSNEAPIDTPDVAVKEVGNVTAKFSVMSQASEEASRIS